RRRTRDLPPRRGKDQGSEVRNLHVREYSLRQVHAFDFIRSVQVLQRRIERKRTTWHSYENRERMAAKHGENRVPKRSGYAYYRCRSRAVSPHPGIVGVDAHRLILGPQSPRHDGTARPPNAAKAASRWPTSWPVVNLQRSHKSILRGLDPMEGSVVSRKASAGNYDG